MMGLGMLIALPAMLVVALVVLAMPLLLLYLVARSSGFLVSRPAGPVAAIAAVCSNCRHGVRADWRSCPYCGQRLA